jgi:hypothetical protein
MRYISTRVFMHDRAVGVPERTNHRCKNHMLKGSGGSREGSNIRAYNSPDTRHQKLREPLCEWMVVFPDPVGRTHVTRHVGAEGQPLHSDRKQARKGNTPAARQSTTHDRPEAISRHDRAMKPTGFPLLSPHHHQLSSSPSVPASSSQGLHHQHLLKQPYHQLSSP